MPDLGAPELLIIALVILVLFGAKKLPDAARSVGRSMRIFKSEIKGMQDDDQPQAISGTSQAQPAPQPQAAPQEPAPVAPAPTREHTDTV